MRPARDPMPIRDVDSMIARGEASAPFTDDDETVSRIVPWQGGFALVTAEGDGWRLVGPVRRKSIPHGARLLSKSEARRMTQSRSPTARRAHEARAEKLAAQGRGGDTDVVHVTPGEIVVPQALQTPAVMAALGRAARARGIDLRRFTVGRGRINPKTGQEQFDLPTYWVIYPGGDYPGQNGMVAPINDLRPQLPDPKDVVPGGQSNGTQASMPPLRTPSPDQPFGPPPADWSNPRDPFGIMNRFEPPPMRIGRTVFDGYQDQTFDAMWRQRAYEAGYDPNNLTPEQHAKLFGGPAQAKPDMAQPKPAPRWGGDLMERAAAFYNDFYGKRPDGQWIPPDDDDRKAMITDLLTTTDVLKNPWARIEFEMVGTDRADPNSFKFRAIDPADLAMLQDIDPRDLDRGEMLPMENQMSFKNTGNIDKTFHHVDANGFLRNRLNVAPHLDPIAAMIYEIRGGPHWWERWNPLAGVDSVSGGLPSFN